MLFFIYDLLLLVFIIISSPYLIVKLFKKNELSLWKQRLGIMSPVKSKSSKKPIWFHAASVGEISGIYPILDSLFQKNKDLEFVVTTYTSTGLKRAKEIFAGYPVVYFSLLPIDLSFIIKSFIKKIDPKIIVVSETELWANMIHQAEQMGIKAIIVNGRISDSSWPKYLSFRFFFKKFVNKIDFYCAQTDIDKNRIISLGLSSKKAEVTGNAKYSFMPVTDKDISIIMGSPVIVAGSTRPGEEEVVLEAFKNFQVKFTNAMLVLAPRHLERIPEVEKLVQKTGISYMLRSRYNANNGEPQFKILILDSLGELSSFYKLSDLSFVGGTLKPFDGHNILEPAAFNKPVLFGPYVNNVKDVAEDLIKSGGGRKVYNAKELEQAFNEILSDKSKNRTMGEKAFFVFKKHKQSAVKQADIILTEDNKD
ncbi:MAG: 3-deoxy-D-manno-octulosonic acid transferase [bacterium]|nr:3-deoxy-D-manno-octulosonic acid transferase [bacterium]